MKDQLTIDEFDALRQMSPSKIRSFFEKNRDLVHIEYDQNLAIAYLVWKFTESFMIAKWIMTEIKSKDPFFTPDKILDFGSGVGSVSLAADTYYDGPKVKAIEPN